MTRPAHQEDEAETNEAQQQQQQHHYGSPPPGRTPAETGVEQSISNHSTTSGVQHDEDDADDDDDDDDVTIILLDPDDHHDNIISLDWINQPGPEMEARRRSILLRELARVQRTSCLHFALLCIIPAALMMVVVVALLSESEVCTSEITYCELEPRTFVNAFTTRCICDPIPVLRTRMEDP